MNAKVADQDQFQVRLPAGMRDRIRFAAAANNRSMNAEIVATLNEAYPPQASWNELAVELSDLAGELSAAGYGSDPFPALRRALDEVRLSLNDYYARQEEFHASQAEPLNPRDDE